MTVTEKDWLAAHPYLQPVAEFHAIAEAAVDAVLNARRCVANWNDHLDDFHAGVPLLRSSKSIIDLKPVEETVPSLIEKLASMTLPNKLGEDMRGLALDLRQIPRGSTGIMAWLLDENGPTVSHRGLLRYMGWIIVAKYLSKVVATFDRWRDEERWLRSYCPLCGSSPAMAQLAGVDPARMRLLSCGCCGTRWRFRRIACPFCENEDDHRLATLAIEGEDSLRIDCCESCNGYVKTYVGAGNEHLMLSDWSSLHLDVIAQDQGLKRMADSLYALIST